MNMEKGKSRHVGRFVNGSEGPTNGPMNKTNKNFSKVLSKMLE